MIQNSPYQQLKRGLFHPHVVEDIEGLLVLSNLQVLHVVNLGRYTLHQSDQKVS